jgi:hypothetical protein
MMLGLHPTIRLFIFAFMAKNIYANLCSHWSTFLLAMRKKVRILQEARRAWIF